MPLMLYGGGVADMRGHAGGTVFTRSRAGTTSRSKTSGIRTTSKYTSESRNLQSLFSQNWSNVLNSTQRASWNAYALTAPVTNALGNVVYLSGHNWYVRANVNITRAAGTAILVPPAGTSYPGLTSLSIVAGHTLLTSLQLTFTFPGAGGTPYLHMFASPAISPGISQVSSRLRFIGAVAMPASPYDASVNYNLRFHDVLSIVGKQVFVLASVVDQASGLISAPFRASAIVT